MSDSRNFYPSGKTSAKAFVHRGTAQQQFDTTAGQLSASFAALGMGCPSEKLSEHVERALRDPTTFMAIINDVLSGAEAVPEDPMAADLCPGPDGLSLRDYLNLINANQDAKYIVRDARGVLARWTASLVSQWMDPTGDQERIATLMPQPPRRVLVPKPDGKLRPISIANVVEQLVACAIHRTVGAAINARQHRDSVGFIPKRGSLDALARIRYELEVVDNDYLTKTDLSDAFGSIPHAGLFARLEELLPGPAGERIVRLLGAFVNPRRVHAERRQRSPGIRPTLSPDQKKRLHLMCSTAQVRNSPMLINWLDGGTDSECSLLPKPKIKRGRRSPASTVVELPAGWRARGVPQGEAHSPDQMNVYAGTHIDWPWHELHPTVRLTRYADDMIFAAKTYSQALKLLSALNGLVERAGLTLAPKKTSIVDITQNTLVVLGHVLSKVDGKMLIALPADYLSHIEGLIQHQLKEDPETFPARAWAAARGYLEYHGPGIHEESELQNILAWLEDTIPRYFPEHPAMPADFIQELREEIIEAVRAQRNRFDQIYETYRHNQNEEEVIEDPGPQAANRSHGVVNGQRDQRPTRGYRRKGKRSPSASGLREAKRWRRRKRFRGRSASAGLPERLHHDAGADTGEPATGRSCSYVATALPHPVSCPYGSMDIIGTGDDVAPQTSISGSTVRGVSDTRSSMPNIECRIRTRLRRRRRPRAPP